MITQPETQQERIRKRELDKVVSRLLRHETLLNTIDSIMEIEPSATTYDIDQLTQLRNQIQSDADQDMAYTIDLLFPEAGTGLGKLAVGKLRQAQRTKNYDDFIDFVVEGANATIFSDNPQAQQMFIQETSKLKDQMRGQ